MVHIERSGKRGHLVSREAGRQKKHKSRDDRTNLKVDLTRRTGAEGDKRNESMKATAMNVAKCKTEGLRYAVHSIYSYLPLVLYDGPCLVRPLMRRKFSYDRWPEII